MAATRSMRPEHIWGTGAFDEDAMKWTTPQSSCEDSTDEYPGLTQQVGGPTSEVAAIADSPLDLFLFYFPKALWVDIAVNSSSETDVLLHRECGFAVSRCLSSCASCDCKHFIPAIAEQKCKEAEVMGYLLLHAENRQCVEGGGSDMLSIATCGTKTYSRSGVIETFHL